MKASEVLPISGDYGIDQRVSPNNKPGPQEPKGDIISVLCNS